jgi:hypothetical protein
MKTEASTRDQIDGSSIMIGVIIASLSSDGGESHGELDMLMKARLLTVGL